MFILPHKALPQHAACCTACSEQAVLKQYLSPPLATDYYNSESAPANHTERNAAALLYEPLVPHAVHSIAVLLPKA